MEARLLVTSLVEDATASGIGDMLRKEESSKQVTPGCLMCCPCWLNLLVSCGGSRMYVRSEIRACW